MDPKPKATAAVEGLSCFVIVLYHHCMESEHIFKQAIAQNWLFSVYSGLYYYKICPDYRRAPITQPVENQSKRFCLFQRKMMWKFFMLDIPPPSQHFVGEKDEDPLVIIGAMAIF